VEALRAIKRAPKSGEVVRLSACDPLNLVGIITPGGRVPATLANAVVFEDGVPVTAERAPALLRPAAGPAMGYAVPSR
jgi:ATP-dependent Lhr-like helicase